MPRYFILLLILLILSFTGCARQAKIPPNQSYQSLKAEIKLRGNSIVYKDNVYESTGGYRRSSNDDLTQLVELNQIGKYEFYIDKEELDFPTQIYVSVSDSEFYDVYKLKRDF